MAYEDIPEPTETEEFMRVLSEELAAKVFGGFPVIVYSDDMYWVNELFGVNLTDSELTCCIVHRPFQKQLQKAHIAWHIADPRCTIDNIVRWVSENFDQDRPTTWMQTYLQDLR